ncbi:MAG TPA: ribonuclease HI family protein [Terriglobales bacterium]|nr:ribonuclease HI family protein [Terriglobales bacterium]
MTQGSLFSGKPASTGQFAIIANIDGGARGNPGPAAYGVVVRDAKGAIIAELSEYLGHQTNNYAEYSGLIAALEYAVRERHSNLKVISDSELMVRQMKGIYRVSNPTLKELYARAQALAHKLEHFAIEHTLREKNRDADRLVNQILDQRARQDLR